MRIDFNTYADAYQRNRAIQPKVLQALIDGAGLAAGDAVLEIGCGTANFSPRSRGRLARAALESIRPSGCWLRRDSIPRRTIWR